MTWQMIHSIHDLSFYYSKGIHKGKKKVWYLIFQNTSEGTYLEAKPSVLQNECDNVERSLTRGFMPHFELQIYLLLSWVEIIII